MWACSDNDFSLHNTTSLSSSYNTEMKPEVSWLESLAFIIGKSEFQGKKLQEP